MIELNSDWAEKMDIPNADGPRGDLPIVELPGGSVSIMESAEKLFGFIAPTKKLFRQGNRVSRITEVEGRIILSPLTAEALRSEVEKHARLVGHRKGQHGADVLKPTICTADMAKALLASSAINLLPPIVGVSDCPLLFEHKGTLRVAAHGYEPELKVFVTGGEPPPQVDLNIAVNDLRAELSEFVFLSPGDEARAIASILTPALKLGGFIRDRVPATVAEADQSQSGKTFLQKLAAAHYNERVFIVAQRKGGVGSVDESFSEAAVAGHSFILFDNLRGLLDSPYLEAFLTADGSFPCRIPHVGTVNVTPDHYLIFLTSNGVETTRDFANRSNIIRIKKQNPGFRFREFPEGGLLDHVRAHQSHYLGCLFAVVRAWFAAGKPTTKETRHDFRQWVGILDWIVQNLFKASPLMDGHQDAQQTVSNLSLVFLRQVALAMKQSESLGVPQTATDIAGVCECHGISIPGAPFGGETDKAARLIGTCLKRLFKETEQIACDGIIVRREVIKEKRDDDKGYYDQNWYVFEAPASETVSAPSTGAAPGAGARKKRNRGMQITFGGGSHVVTRN